MNKLINFIESEWSRPAIVCFVIFLFCFFGFFLSLAEKREAHRIETQRQAWIDEGYPMYPQCEFPAYPRDVSEK